MIFTINTTLLSLLLSEAQAKDKYFQTYFVLRQHSLVPEWLSLRHAINDGELKIIFSHLFSCLIYYFLLVQIYSIFYFSFIL